MSVVAGFVIAPICAAATTGASLVRTGRWVCTVQYRYVLVRCCGYSTLYLNKSFACFCSFFLPHMHYSPSALLASSCLANRSPLGTPARHVLRAYYSILHGTRSQAAGSVTVHGGSSVGD